MHWQNTNPVSLGYATPLSATSPPKTEFCRGSTECLHIKMEPLSQAVPMKIK